MPDSRKYFEYGAMRWWMSRNGPVMSRMAVNMIFKKLSSSGHKIHDGLEKLKKKIYAALPDQKRLEQSRAYHIFGTTLFKKELWSFKGEALARGIGLGLFVAFTPTIGFQMIIVCVLILFIPGNLPIALAASWVTNVFTAGPVYFFEYRFGQWLIEVTGAAPYQPIQNAPAISGLYDIAGAMWLGSLVISLVAGLGGYILTLAFINFERKLRMSKITSIRNVKRADPSEKPNRPDFKNNRV